MSVSASKALETFLRHALCRKVDRVLGFALSPKRQAKFLNLIPHELGQLLDDNLAVEDLPPYAWSAPAYLFSPPDVFGHLQPSLRTAYQRYEDATLVLSTDGLCGFWREDTYADTQLLFSFTE